MLGHDQNPQSQQEDSDKIFVLVLELTNPDQVTPFSVISAFYLRARVHRCPRFMSTMPFVLS